MIIDAWVQHPSAELLADPMFDSLRRWARGQLASGEVPVEATVAAMDAAGVRTGMLCAWWGPRGPLISNDAVAAITARYPGRFAGVAAVDLARPMDAVRELRRCVRELGFRAGKPGEAGELIGERSGAVRQALAARREGTCELWMAGLRTSSHERTENARLQPWA